MKRDPAKEEQLIIQLELAKEKTLEKGQVRGWSR
jgi:hypothetical protein